MIRFKKRVISLAVLELFVTAVIFLLSFIPVGMYSFNSYGNFGGSLFNLILTAVLTILLIKNEHLFKN
jgi:hypothetical protein